MPKAALHNLGCKVNAYETEAMEQQLKERGYEIVPFDEKADVILSIHVLLPILRTAIKTDAPSCKEAESGICSGGSRLLCAGGIGRVEERCQRGYCNWKQ